MIIVKMHIHCLFSYILVNVEINDFLIQGILLLDRRISLLNAHRKELSLIIKTHFKSVKPLL